MKEPPSVTPLGTNRRGISKAAHATLLSGLSSLEEPGCSELLQPAGCSVQGVSLCRSWAGQNRATVATPRISQGIHARRNLGFTAKGDVPVPSYAQKMESRFRSKPG